MCTTQRWQCVSAKTCWDHFHTFTMIYTSAISLNKSYLNIANCKCPTPLLNAGKEILIFIICFDDVNKHKSEA